MLTSTSPLGKSAVVRIIGGRLKRSVLPVPQAEQLRPTPQRVRETLFNWLGQDLSGLRCLDLFAGSGVLGMEAASRGAARVDMVEFAPKLAQNLRKQVQRLGLDSVAHVWQIDAMRLLSKPASFLSAPGVAPVLRWDVVFLDPPFVWPTEQVDAVLVATSAIIAPGGLLHLESPQPRNAQVLAALGWSVVRQGRAGAVHHCLLTPVGLEADSSPQSAGCVS